MTLKEITLQFDTPEEQEFVENEFSYSILAKETWPEDSGFNSWTTFDIKGCEPHDLLELDEIADEWYENEWYEKE